MTGKIGLVTGANSGIGFATAEGLAKQGARVVMVSRDAERGEEARRQLVRRTGNANIDLLVADLSSQQEIRRLARQFEERYDKLDVLVNNAGGVFAKKEMSADGYEMTFAVNYLAPFLLTHLLLDRLKASGAGRIVNVASIMQAKRFQPDESAQPRRYSSMTAYKEAKVAVLMMTYTLAERLAGSGITVNALHPGVIYTPQSARMAPAFARPLMKLFMSTPEQGARMSLYMASSPDMNSVSGKFYAKGQARRTVPVSYDSKLQEELYNKSIRWAGLTLN
ncbi:SDR family oxidoreductase [Cohnella sp. AR92]|uniref:SDR family oxidoreductase n=1 Tax=Cohnella sp. AR92 TaxID=648716 RepID=UPI000F8C5BA3|nr:SDR family oxidoreductase [Cohnella sp. AR92]RUS45691.1 SDR family oxidoreductase [Cohnella sp. AR92]